jgi:hypothetical protein
MRVCDVVHVLFQEKWHGLLSSVVCCLHLCDFSYPCEALGRHFPVLSGQMPSYHIVRRQGFVYLILVT